MIPDEDERIEDGRLLDIGDTFTDNGNTFECTAVSSQADPDGTLHDFVYEFRLKSEVDAKIEREIEAAKEQDRLFQEQQAEHDAQEKAKQEETANV